MTTTVAELLLSRYLTEDEDNPSAQRRYKITNDTTAIDESDAETALLAAIPDPYRGLPVVQYQIEPTESEFLWIGIVNYGKKQVRESGTGEYDFDVGVKSEKRTQAIATTAYTASGTAPDFKNAIGVSGDRIEGADINVPTFGFSVTRFVDAADVDATLIGNLYSCAAKVNSASYTVKGVSYAAGELLFLGCSGALRRSDQYALTYRFEANKNVTGQTVGGITGISKKGWEFLDVLYDDVADGSANNFVVKRPRAVYVHQVYETANFSTLLGTL